MGNKNAWFKHYNSASDGQTLDLLFAAQDYETICFYWWLLERVSKYETAEKRGTCTLSYHLIKRKLGWNSQRTSRNLRAILEQTSLLIEPCSDPKLFTVSVPNWLEFQENRGGKRTPKSEQSDDRRQKENKEIEKTDKEEVLSGSEIKNQKAGDLTQGEQLLKFWNSQNWNLPKVFELTQQQKEFLDLRLKEAPLESWQEAIRKMHLSDFLLGKLPGQTWKATFDWLIASPEPRVKIMNGQYLPRNSKSFDSEVLKAEAAERARRAAQRTANELARAEEAAKSATFEGGLRGVGELKTKISEIEKKHHGVKQ